jgi:hypothetical protein
MSVVVYPESAYVSMSVAIEAAQFGAKRIAGLTALSDAIGTNWRFRIYRATLPTSTLAAESSVIAAKPVVNGTSRRIMIPGMTLTLLADLKAVGEPFFFRAERDDASVGFYGFVPPEAILSRDTDTGETVEWIEAGYGLPAFVDEGGAPNLPAPPTVLTASSVSGTSAEGSTLTGAPAVFSGADQTALRWTLDNIDVPGQVATTFLLPGGSATKVPRFVSRGSNAGGSIESTAAASAVSAAPTPAPAPAPPPAPPSCVVQITGAPGSIAQNALLNYTVSMASGPGTAFQTWLVAPGGGGATGAGYVGGQGITVIASGQYRISLAGVPVGNYLLWAKCNDNGTCQDAFTTIPITVTAAEGVVAPVINWDAPSPSTTVSTGWGEARKGSAAAINDVWNIGNWNLTLGGNCTQSVTIGDALNNSNSFRIQASLPTSGIVWTAGGSPNTEVKTYPKMGVGQLPGAPNYGHPGLPARASKINRAWLGIKSISDSVTTGFGHLSHDFRMMDSGEVFSGYNAAAPHIKQELFVVVKQWNGYGVHPGGRGPDWYHGEYTIGGIAWHFYIQPGATGTNQLIWIPKVFPLVAQFDFAELMKWAMAMRHNQLTLNAPGILNAGRSASDTLIDPNHFLVSNALGVEVVSGNYDVTCNTCTLIMDVLP